jgi:hypothetical protein
MYDQQRSPRTTPTFIAKVKNDRDKQLREQYKYRREEFTSRLLAFTY